METMKSIMMILPESIRRIVKRMPSSLIDTLEELRIRENRPMEAVMKGGYGFVTVTGEVVQTYESAYRPNHQDCMQLIDLLSNHSLYTMEEELKRGYVTIRGGHRVGIAGRTILHHSHVKQIRDISSFNIRIAREIKNAALEILPQIYDHRNQRIYHTLVLSPPQKGKTTLIRDMTRSISHGFSYGGQRFPSMKVGIVDERSEIAACYQGVPHFDMGPRSDVMDACPKAEGMMMMIRSMSPEVLVVDEIGRGEDTDAIMEAVNAGIQVIATAHAGTIPELKKRPAMLPLIENRVFSRYIILNQTIGQPAKVYNENFQQITRTLLRKV